MRFRIQSAKVLAKRMSKYYKIVLMVLRGIIALQQYSAPAFSQFRELVAYMSTWGDWGLQLQHRLHLSHWLATA